MKRSKVSVPFSMSREELLALEAYSSSNFFKVNKKLFKAFNTIDAILITELMDKYLYWKEKNQLTEDGFFFTTHEMIEDHIGLSSYQIRERKKFLRENELLETSMRGIPAKEFYKVNIENLLNYIDKRIAEKGCTSIPLKIRGQSSKKLEEYTSKNLTNIKENKYKENKYKENKYKENISLSEEKLPTIKNTEKELSPEEIKNNKTASRLSNILKDILSVEGKITKGTRTNTWPDSFRKLITIDDIPPARIRKLLNWYEDHVGEDMVPQCYSAKSFREKFIRLEDAMKRDTGQNKKSKPKTRLGGAEVIPRKYDDYDYQEYNADTGELIFHKGGRNGA